jgi:hypothetical protein
LPATVLGRRHRITAQQQIKKPLVLDLVRKDLLEFLTRGQSRLDVLFLLVGVVQPQDRCGVPQVLVSGVLLLD